MAVMRHLSVPFIAALAFVAHTDSWAWGGQGHRIVGLIADSELTPKTRIAVRHILRDDSLASVANWMDEVRDTLEGRSMRRWHFVSRKVCGSGEPSCKNGNCASAKIEWARDTLKADSPEDARQALSVLVHLVGDIHQPLHASDNGDFGANGVTVTNRLCVEFGSSKPTHCKLHTYWHSSLVKAALRGQSERAAAASWSSAFGALPANDPGEAKAWAAESFELAKQTAYRFDGFTCKKNRTSFEATNDYDTAALAAIRPQIAKAGKRLAKALNEIFD